MIFFNGSRCSHFVHAGVLRLLSLTHLQPRPGHVHERRPSAPCFKRSWGHACRPGGSAEVVDCRDVIAVGWSGACEWFVLRNADRQVRSFQWVKKWKLQQLSLEVFAMTIAQRFMYLFGRLCGPGTNSSVKISSEMSLVVGKTPHDAAYNTARLYEEHILLEEQVSLGCQYL